MKTAHGEINIALQLKDIKIFLFFLLFTSLICLLLTIFVDHFGVQHKYLLPFNMHGESTIPTWIHSTILFINFIICTSIYRSHIYKSHNKLFKASWIFFTTLFIYIAVDESSMVHEWVGTLYHDIAQSGFLNLPVGYFLTAFAPFILMSILLMVYLFYTIFRDGYIKEALLAVAALSFWVFSIIVEKIDGIYKQSDFFMQSNRYIIRYITEYSEVFGTVIFSFFLLKYLSSISKR